MTERQSSGRTNGNFTLISHLAKISALMTEVSFRFSLTEGMLCVLIRIASMGAILLSTHSIPYQYKKENHPKLSQPQKRLQLWDFC